MITLYEYLSRIDEQRKIVDGMKGSKAMATPWGVMLAKMDESYKRVEKMGRDALVELHKVADLHYTDQEGVEQKSAMLDVGEAVVAWPKIPAGAHNLRLVVSEARNVKITMSVGQPQFIA